MVELAKALPWLTIIGIGEDGIAGLGDAAKLRIAAADLVCGGTRHLELASGLINGERHQWLSPIEKSVDFIQAARGRNVCVLASGDPFHFGMGATLARSIDPADPCAIRIQPCGVSSGLADPAGGADLVAWPSIGPRAATSPAGRPHHRLDLG